MTMTIKYIPLLCLLPLHVNATLGCISKLIEVQNCTDAYACDCGVAEVSDNPFQNGFCDIVSLAFCTPHGNCPSCEYEYQQYEDCIADFVATITFQQCVIDCNAAPVPAATPSTISPTGGPSPPTGPSPTRTPTRAPLIPTAPTTSAPITPPKTLRPLTSPPFPTANPAPFVAPVVIALPTPTGVTTAQLANNPDSTLSSGNIVKVGMLTTLGVAVVVML